jgi:hypothetical protein
VKDRGKKWVGRAALAIALLMLLALPLACGGDEETAATIVERSATAVTAAGAAGADEAYGQADGEASLPPVASPEAAQDTAAGGSSAEGSSGGAGSLTAAQNALGRKVISNASLQIEVERGKFQDAFDRALLLADKYGGYVVSSQASGGGGEEEIRSGTVAIRIPSQSFNLALTDVGDLGKLRGRQIDSQDVTEEFVDLEARLSNAQAQEKALQALLVRAKTIDEVLQVRQVLTSIQAEIEQIKGRLAFLEEHTNYSTITISVFETGVEVASTGGWGFLEALRDAARGFVATLNSMIVTFGEGLPVLVLLAVLAWIALKVLRPYLLRRRPTV